MKVLYKTILLLAFTIIYLPSFGQNKDTIEKSQYIEPTFPGGSEMIDQIIHSNMQYPIGAIEDKVSGTIITRFVIDTTGNISDITVSKGIRPDMDKEAIRLAGLLNGWIPAIVNGNKVKVIYLLPISFYIDKNLKRKQRRKL
jgi:hypothetical protein